MPPNSMPFTATTRCLVSWKPWATPPRDSSGVAVKRDARRSEIDSHPLEHAAPLCARLNPFAAVGGGMGCRSPQRVSLLMWRNGNIGRETMNLHRIAECEAN